MLTTQTTCPLDCPDTCSLNVNVERDRITQVRAGPGHPFTKGFICSKVAKSGARLDHKKRLTSPLRRTGAKGEGRFEAISWEEAIAEITGRFQLIADEFGGEAIAPCHYGGSNGLLTDGFLDRLYFARLGASRLQKTICAAPATAVAMGMYGKMPGVAYPDYPKAECIVVWGANPKASSIHLVPFLKEAKRRGAFVAHVDPRKTFSDSEVDLHLPVRPGTDLPVALAMINYFAGQGLVDREFLKLHAVDADRLFEAAGEWSIERAADVSGISASDIKRLADVYAASSPAVIRVGWGLERNRNGGQALAAIMAMPAVMGKFGIRAGGYTMSNGGAFSNGVEELLGGVKWDTREINQSRFGRELLDATDPPIKGVFVYNCNPVVTLPNQRAVVDGFLREDLFTVVFDQVHTDSVDYADIVLPATTNFEHYDIKPSYGGYVVGGITPVVEPRGETRSNQDVFQALGRAMGFSDEPFEWDPETFFRRVGETIRFEGEEVDLERVLSGAVFEAKYNKGGPVQFEDVFPRTTDSKIHLAAVELGADPYAFMAEEDETFPLTLISPAHAGMITSTFGETNCSTLTVSVNPEDARSRGVEDGAEVRVFNDLGEVSARAVVTGSIRPGVVCMPKGAWMRSTPGEWTSNVLCPDHVNVVGGGACYNDARVELECL